ncbi:MAG: YceI family protein, partial [Pseudomonadota bacterium]
ALITGDLTMNDVTKSVVLDTTLNQKAPYPFGPKQGTPTLGLDATATVLRSDFNLGAFAPAVGDEVAIMISIEAWEASGDGS